MPTVPYPENVRPHQPIPEALVGITTKKDGYIQTWRQVGWIGHRDGAMYSLSESPSSHEPGGFSPLFILTHNGFQEMPPDNEPAAKHDRRGPRLI